MFKIQLQKPQIDQFFIKQIKTSINMIGIRGSFVYS